MWPLTFFALFVLGLLAFRGARWAYVSFVLLGLLYFPARVGFHFKPRVCQLALNLPLAIHSLTNYPRIALFALFFVMTSVQFRAVTRSALVQAGLLMVGMGVLVELAEGMTGKGNCRLRDLVPDSAGALLGAAIVFLWKRLGVTPPSTRPSD